MCLSQGLLRVLQFFKNIIYLFRISVYFVLSLYFTPKLFCFFSFRLLVYCCTFSTNLWKIIFVIFECTFLFVLFYPISPSFWVLLISTICFIYFFQMCCQTCLRLSIWKRTSFSWIFVCSTFLCSFACCRRFFIRDPGFVMWLVYLRIHLFRFWQISSGIDWLNQFGDVRRDML